MVKCFTLFVCLALAACGANTRAIKLPTAEIRLTSIALAPIERLAVHPTFTLPGLPSPQAAEPVSATPSAELAPLDQYRAWMIEAQALYPYPEPLQAMWDVMLCESSGNPNTITGANQGLFQYDSATWVGDWNPYRDQPILDAHAQIFATAKAWHDGNQHWWSCYQG